MFISLLLLLMTLLAVASTFLATETGSQWLTRRAIEQLAAQDNLSLTVDEIRGNLLQGLQLQALQYSDGRVEVQVQELTAAWNPWSLLAGSLQMSQVGIRQSTVRLLPPEQAAPAPATENPLADFEFAPLPVAVEVASLTLDSLSFIDEQQQIVIDRLDGSVSLQDRNLRITGLHLEAAQGSIQGAISVQLAANMPLEVDLDWRYQESLPLQLDAAAGHLQLAGSLANLEIDHALTEPFTIRSRGSVQPFAEQGPTLDIAHSAGQLLLELEAMTLELESLQLGTSGRPDNLGLALQSNLLQPWGPLEIDLQAALADNRLSVDSLSLLSSGGESELQGRVDFSGDLQAEGEFTIAEASPLQALNLSAPVSLSDLRAEGNFALRMENDQPRIELSLGESSVVMNDYALTGSGNVSWADSSLSVSNLLLQSDANSLALNGALAEAAAQLQFSLDAPRLEQFVPGLQARATGTGSLSGTLAEPVVAMELRLEDVASEWAELASVNITANGNPDNYQAQLELATGSLLPAGADIALQQASLTFNGNRQAHELDLQIDTDPASAELGLSGGFVDAETLDWRGRLETANLNSDAGSWQMLAVSNLSYINQQFTVPSSCWSYGQVQLCLELQPAEQSGRYIAEGSLSNFPLEEFNTLVADEEPLLALAQIPRLPEGVNLSGEASSSLFVEFGGDQGPRFDFTAISEAAVLTLLSNQQDEFGAATTAEEVISQDYRWQRLSLQGSFQNERWQFNSRAQLNTDHIQDSDLELAGNLQASLQIDPARQLSGSAEANFDDLGWVAAFIPELSDVSGVLDSNLQFAGSLDAPRLTGELRVNGGAFHIERLGVDYSDFEFFLASENARQATLEGSVASTAGFLTFNGQATGINSSNWTVQAKIEGEQFQLASLPDLLLDVSPRVSLDANSQRIALNGTLDVPLLDLTLRELPASAVDISRDVVIVDYPQDRPELALSFSSGQTAIFDLPLALNLDLVLGEQVNLQGFGLDAALAGSLNIQQAASGNNLTYGELEITQGSFGIYGQTLSLSDGKLLFLGNYSNPALDIRAVREVQDLTVGVLMNGTLKNIESELFSTPSLPENEILAVLVTGRPFSQLQSSDSDAMVGAIASLGIRQSQALTNQIADRFGLDSVAITNTGSIDSSTLTVGKYLTPDVFIRYGVGLFDNTSKVAVDYLITDRLTLQAESGEYQSIDFTYRVER
jgi:translocation and assembly module TamB